MSIKFVRVGLNGNKANEKLKPMANETIKIVGAVLEQTAKQHCQFSLFTTKSGQMTNLWPTDPRILISSMAMDANYSFELIFIETYAPQFIGHNKFFLGSVFSFYFQLKTCTL